MEHTKNIIKQRKKQTLQPNFFQKVVECENKIQKEYTQENLYEIIELYKVKKNLIPSPQ